MSTSLPNPDLSPEAFTRVAVLNFSVTRDGLEEVLLAVLLEMERPALQQRLVDIVVASSARARDIARNEVACKV